jgi:hypothetical protein
MNLLVVNNSLIRNDLAKLMPNKIVPYNPPTIIVDPTVYSDSLKSKLIAKGYNVIFVKEDVVKYINDHKNTLLLTNDLMSTINLTREKWFLVNHPEALQNNIQILDKYILNIRKRQLNE